MLRIIMISIVAINLYAASLVEYYIPKRASSYVDMVQENNNLLFNKIVMTPYFQALIEQESCVRLKGNSYWARKCWNPKVELKTKREQGAGVLQVTRVFRKDGTVRWDALLDVRRKYPKYLHKLTWNNIRDEPRLQILAGMLIWRHNYLRFSKSIPLYERLKFSDSAYNAGYGNVLRRRQMCKLRKNCNPNIWDGNVGKMNPTGNRYLYGKRRAVDINNEHVNTVFNKRIYKYILLDMAKQYDLFSFISALPYKVVNKLYDIDSLIQKKNK